MLDPSTRLYTCMRQHPHADRLSPGQATKLESMLARTYTDDNDIRGGALSAPRNHSRPGLRDDEVNCSFVGMIPVI